MSVTLALTVSQNENKLFFFAISIAILSSTVKMFYNSVCPDMVAMCTHLCYNSVLVPLGADIMACIMYELGCGLHVCGDRL